MLGLRELVGRLSQMRNFEKRKKKAKEEEREATEGRLITTCLEGRFEDALDANKRLLWPRHFEIFFLFFLFFLALF